MNQIVLAMDIQFDQPSAQRHIPYAKSPLDDWRHTRSIKTSDTHRGHDEKNSQKQKNIKKTVNVLRHNK